MPDGFHGPDSEWDLKPQGEKPLVKGGKAEHDAQFVHALQPTFASARRQMPSPLKPRIPLDEKRETNAARLRS